MGWTSALVALGDVTVMSHKVGQERRKLMDKEDRGSSFQVSHWVH